MSTFVSLTGKASGADWRPGWIIQQQQSVDSDVFPWSNGETAAAVCWVRFPSLFQIPNLALASIQSVISCMLHKAFVRGSFALVLRILLLNTIASCSWLITEDVKPKATRGQTRPYIYGTAMFKRSHPVKTTRCKPCYCLLKAKPRT